MTNSSDDPFTEQKAPETKTEEDPSVAQADPFADKLKTITNEQGQPKYDSTDKALEALDASQQFIETLKKEKQAQSDELAQARAEIAKLGSIESFVEKLNPTMKTEEPQATTEVSGLSEEAVNKLLQAQLNQRDEQSQQDSNLAKVIKGLTNEHGDKASEFIRQRAKELDTTPEKLKQLAKSDPALVMQALASDKSSSPSSSQSSFNKDYTPKNDNPKPTWEKGAARGGMTDRELAVRWRETQAYTNKRLGLE